MSLNNLAKTGVLKKEDFDKQEFLGLIKSGKNRLNDANNISLCSDSRFDLAYNASHSLALAALRWHGYRPSNRYIVFQALPHTTNLGPEVWKIFDKSHNVRNVSEYEGYFDFDEQLLEDLLNSANILLKKIEEFPFNNI